MARIENEVRSAIIAKMGSVKKPTEETKVEKIVSKIKKVVKK